MWTFSFWKQALERGGLAVVAAVVAYLGAAEDFDLWSLDWRALLNAATYALLVGVGSALLTGRVGEKTTPSLVSTRPKE